MTLFRPGSHESSYDDNFRTGSLLDAADRAFEGEPETELHEAFEDVVVAGLLCDAQLDVYPPAGHTYPRKG
ncbi:hypothetical protein HZZ00_37240 (plasmid) [Streptomyces sp. NEAU-sy36]|uniref:hypothetical protein n=1 Tax=unclassified Streptomyces TaxID=2593676 RepID=UPI0015D5D2F6|nr:MULTISPECIES: hypothetical protein [unclassified Streptomyces]QLJ06679.1 hypothetical protein HZZ00_37240 [Streptomyces sp. NEAU-sy36]